MSGIRKLRNRVAVYQARYGLKGLKISEFYDLKLDWETSYPFTSDPGVYVILDEKKKVLYVGKASMNSSIGSRLGSYFKNAEDGSFTTRKRDKWTHKPRYIVTVKVATAYEAPSLEEYLIGELSPEDNEKGRIR